MSKNTSILLGDYFDKFINSQLNTGKYSSASEVVRAALRLFELEESTHGGRTLLALASWNSSHW